MKVAFVYDRVNKIGGAERVLKTLHEIWPNAPLYTAVYNAKTARWARPFKVIPSFLQHLPFIAKHHEWFAWAMPAAFESFDFSTFDVVISITSAEAKSIITKPETVHICYLLTPTRYLWSHTHFYLTGRYATNKNFITRKLTPLIFSLMRQWDQIAAQRPDKIISISQTVSDRCHKYYRRQPDTLIYPPVPRISEASDKSVVLPEEYYLLVSRLVPYKRIDLAIEAFNHLGKILIIIGDGAQKQYLKGLCNENVKILGKLTQKKLARYYQGCRALIFPSEEDFGIVCVEAQTAGKPVIAFYKGGAADTVIHKRTGFLFKQQSVKSLITAINKFETMTFERKDCQANAKRFSKAIFKKNFKAFVEEQWKQYKNQKI